MASRRIPNVSLPWTSVVATSTTDVWYPVTDYEDAGGFGTARSWMELRGKSNAVLVVPAVQTANDPRSPDAPVAIPILNGVSGYANAEGVFDPAAVTSIASDKKLIRYGWLVKLASGTVGAARVAGQIQVLF